MADIWPPGSLNNDGDVLPPTTAVASPAAISTKDEGILLSAAVTTLDFVGAGVTAAGAGATTTITIPGGSSTPVDAQYVTLATDATLTQERVLTGTAADISVTDNGAGSTVVLDLINTAVTPGSYGSATQSPAITVDAKGRITAAANTTITGTGDLTTGWLNKSLLLPWARTLTHTGIGIFASASLSGPATWSTGSAVNPVANPTSSTTALLSLPRMQHATTAGQQTLFAHGQTGANLSPLWMGNGTGVGGFRYVMMFGFETVVGTQTQFVGVRGSSSVISAISLPWSTSTSLVNMIVVGADPGVTALDIWHNDGSNAPTVVSTGLSYAAGDVFKFELQTNGGSNSVDWILTKYTISGGNLATTSGSGNLSTNLPVNTIFLAPNLEINNGTSGTPGVASLSVMFLGYDVFGQ